MNENLTKSFETVLNKRAKELAKRVEERAEERSQTLLEFTSMGQRLAVHLHRVTAVARIMEITPIPLVPKHISGIIRRRGESIALVNLMRFFNADQEGISDADFAVIVTGGKRRFALQADDVIGVSAVPTEALKRPQDNFDKAQHAYISWVTLDGLVLLNLDRLVEAKGFVAEKSMV